MTTTDHPADLVAYEYLTVPVAHELETLYRDTYANFGWTLEGYGPAVPGSPTTTLKLKRDRRINNRRQVLDLQRQAESSLATIASLERSKTTTPTAVALGIGIVGSGLLAGSILTTNTGLWALGIPLGFVGLLGWNLGCVEYGRSRAKKNAEIAPLIDREYAAVHAAAERANLLLAT